MLRMNRQGFTLIELMVVIVIIGVLASLAIPRFTDASVKAKVAEAPRVLASYESARLAAAAEGGTELIFEVPRSKWFTYEVTTDINTCKGTQSADLKIKGTIGAIVSTTYDADTDKFTRNDGGLNKYIPNFTATNQP